MPTPQHKHKQYPGPMFPWRRLVDAGLVPWPDTAAAAAALPGFVARLPDLAWFQQRLAESGFAVPQTGQLDDGTRRVITALQMMYRPTRHDGQPDAATGERRAYHSNRAPGEAHDTPLSPGHGHQPSGPGPARRRI